MSVKQKFSEEEIDKLKSMQDRFNNIVLQLGQINIEIIKVHEELVRLQELKTKLEDDYKKLRAEEVSLSVELSKKYGSGILNPDTGEFTPEKNKNE
jgi:hypothetical protein